MDNAGNRQVKARDLLFEQLGVRTADTLWLRHEFTWRGTRRGVEIVFTNIRTLPDESLRARGNDWKVVIDSPFGPDGRKPMDDLARIDEFRRRGEPSRTLTCSRAWWRRSRAKRRCSSSSWTG